MALIEDPTPEEAEEAEPEDEAEAEADENNPKPPPEPAPAPAPRYPNPSLDIPLQTKVAVTLGALPPDVTSLVAAVTCFGESGLKHVRSAYLRVVDTTEEGGVARDRDLGRVVVHSGESADVDSAAVVLGMVQRAWHGGALWRWR
ncbi:MAG: hypothetical protein MJA30_16970, partial [Cytophagales bacterium]|nr:hypothetical protein [Cytophagales bacterium]